MKKIKAVLLFCLFACLVLVVSCDGIIKIAPKPGTTDPANPDSSNPNPSNPDTPNPDPSNPDPSNPDPSNPDPSNPDPSNPDPSNPDTPLPPGSAGTSKDNPLTGTRADFDKVDPFLTLFTIASCNKAYSEYCTNTQTIEGGKNIDKTEVSECTVTAGDGTKHTVSGLLLQIYEESVPKYTISYEIIVDGIDCCFLQELTEANPGTYCLATINGVWYRFQKGIAPGYTINASKEQQSLIYEIIGHANSILAEEYATLTTHYETNCETRIIPEREILDSNNEKHSISATIYSQPDLEPDHLWETYDVVFDNTKYIATYRGTPTIQNLDSSSYSGLSFSLGEDIWYSDFYPGNTESWHEKGISPNFPIEATPEIIQKIQLIRTLNNTLLDGTDYKEYVSTSDDGSTTSVRECIVTIADKSYTVSMKSVTKSYASVNRAYATINMTIDGTKYYTLAKGTTSAQDDRLFCYTDNCWYYLTPSEIV